MGSRTRAFQSPGHTVAAQKSRAPAPAFGLRTRRPQRYRQPTEHGLIISCSCDARLIARFTRSPPCDALRLTRLVSTSRGRSAGRIIVRLRRKALRCRRKSGD